MSLASLNNFQQRVLVSIISIALIACLIVLAHTPPLHYLFVLGIAIIQATALWEYFTLSEIKGFQPLKKLACIGSCVYIILYYLLANPHLAIPFLLAFTLIAFLFHFNRAEQAIVNLAITLFGVVYITVPLGFLLDITFMNSSIWIIYLLVVTKITDTAAYCAGKLVGSRHLAPLLSPKKTIEGALAGLLGATLMSLAFVLLLPLIGITSLASFSLLDATLVGVGLGVISQLGDLAESLLKRDAQVKDSNSLPGFGGMLDVVDSLIFTTPFLYYCLKAKQLL